MIDTWIVVSQFPGQIALHLSFFIIRERNRPMECRIIIFFEFLERGLFWVSCSDKKKQESVSSKPKKKKSTPKPNKPTHTHIHTQQKTHRRIKFASRCSIVCTLHALRERKQARVNLFI